MFKAAKPLENMAPVVGAKSLPPHPLQNPPPSLHAHSQGRTDTDIQHTETCIQNPSPNSNETLGSKFRTSYGSSAEMTTELSRDGSMVGERHRKLNIKSWAVFKDICKMFLPLSEWVDYSWQAAPFGGLLENKLLYSKAREVRRFRSNAGMGDMLYLPSCKPGFESRLRSLERIVGGSVMETADLALWECPLLLSKDLVSAETRIRQS